MPEYLLPHSYSLPVMNFQPRVLDLDPPPDVEGAKARAFASIADSLGKLPGNMIEQYGKGKELALERQAQNFLSKKLAPGADMTGVAVDSTGKLMYTGPKYPYEKAGKGTLYDSIGAGGGPGYTSSKLSVPASGVVEPDLPTGGEGGLGKVTSYGYANDETPDANSSAGIGAFVPDEEAAKIKRGEPSPYRLTEGDIAVSPDIEEQLVAKGIKPRDSILLKMADGSTRRVRWADRTSNALKGRFDFYSPGGLNKDEGMRVIGWDPAGADEFPRGDPTTFPEAKPLSSVPPDRVRQINEAATNIAGKLSGAGTDMAALNLTAGPGGVPAQVAPAGAPAAAPATREIEVRRPIVGFNRQLGAKIMAPDPTNVKAVYPNDTVVDITPKAEKQSPTENAVDRRIISLGGNPEDMSPGEKTAYLSKQMPLKPSEKLTATRDLRTSYHDLPSTITLFGKGQMPGLNQVMERLDQIKQSAGDDFSKMTPQEAATLVFQFSKFNDPNSAVLLGEYRAAAGRLGLLDRGWQALNQAMTGQAISPAQAQDIYKVVSAAHDRAKANYVEDAADILAAGKELGVDPRRLGIPSNAEKWLTEKPGEGATTTVDPQRQEALEWLKANPNDPRAAEIRKRLGVQ